MNVLVTGALGHIGSKLMYTLRDSFSDGHITLVDNLLTQRYCSLFNLDAQPAFTFVELDILDAEIVDLISTSDIVIHLAAITDATSSYGNIEEVERINFDGLVRVADICAAKGTKLIFLSSTSVYSGTEKSICEKDDILEFELLSPYAQSKLKAERYLSSLDSLDYVTLRFGTIIGPSQGMRFHTAVNKFIWQVVNGLPITVWKTAMDQVRPYLSLSDAVEAICFVARSLYSSDVQQEVYNVASANLSVRSILDKLRVHSRELNVSEVESDVMNSWSFGVSSQKIIDAGFSFNASIEKEIADTFKLLEGIRRD